MYTVNILKYLFHHYLNYIHHLPFLPFYQLVMSIHLTFQHNVRLLINLPSLWCVVDSHWLLSYIVISHLKFEKTHSPRVISHTLILTHSQNVFSYLDYSRHSNCPFHSYLLLLLLLSIHPLLLLGWLSLSQRCDCV